MDNQLLLAMVLKLVYESSIMWNTEQFLRSCLLAVLHVKTPWVVNYMGTVTVGYTLKPQSLLPTELETYLG